MIFFFGHPVVVVVHLCLCLQPHIICREIAGHCTYLSHGLHLGDFTGFITNFKLFTISICKWISYYSKAWKCVITGCPNKYTVSYFPPSYLKSCSSSYEYSCVYHRSSVKQLYWYQYWYLPGIYINADTWMIVFNDTDRSLNIHTDSDMVHSYRCYWNRYQ